MKDLEKTYIDFISTVSHELRTPLTSIRGFADVLLNSYDQLSEEQRIKFLEIIKSQSNRLIKLIENLLAVSKMTTEESVFVFKNVSPQKVIEQAVQLVKAQYKSHFFDIQIGKNISEIMVDEDKLLQVLLNLVENAAKYSAEKATVTIRVKNTQGNKTAIQIQDEGIGIPKEHRAKVFEKFSRLDNPLTRKVEGTGLGLYIAKTITDKMKGKLELLDSESGCLFQLTFENADITKQSMEKFGKKL